MGQHEHCTLLKLFNMGGQSHITLDMNKHSKAHNARDSALYKCANGSQSGAIKYGVSLTMTYCSDTNLLGYKKAERGQPSFYLFNITSPLPAFYRGKSIHRGY